METTANIDEPNVNMFNNVLKDVDMDNSDDIALEVATEYTLDIPRISSVELPLKLSHNPASMVKAIRMCGGLDKIKEVLSENSDSEKVLELYLNEGQDNDGSEKFFNEHGIQGKKVRFRDESVILKITMPKGTLAEHNGNIPEALSSLDHDSFSVVPVAIVNNTIKYREMSDFQIRLDNNPSANEFKNSFGSLDWGNFQKFVRSVPDNDVRPYENINNIVLDRSASYPNTDFQLPPPPRLSMVGLPFLYKYKGNPFAVKKSDGAAEVKGSYIKNYQIFIHGIGEDVSIPVQAEEQLLKDFEQAKTTGVYPGTKKESKFFESLEQCIEIVTKLFEERPIWVKRHIDGIVPKSIHHTLKIALALMSYRFTMGPWRNTYIKFGIDPRTSSEYAKYQTEYFKIERRLLKSPNVSKNIPNPPSIVFESNVKNGIDTRFIFDGKSIPWYLMLQIDLLITEPNIAEIFEKIEYLDKANEGTGWFSELDLTKIRRIVKYELCCMAQGNFSFNKYKLKYFKSMIYTKESMIENKEKEEKDNDGDYNMDSDVKSKDSDADNDNDITVGDADKAALEAEEDETEPIVNIAPLESSGSSSEGFKNDLDMQGEIDLNAASFQDILSRIRKIDSSAANRLEKELNGFIQESHL
ncbi:hypothetical protein TPHA_0A02350 [Tetrapisispora phaffii CBS 4417]|uniref:Transcription factor IIIC subunit 5 HTH domain-containing protein n=1 Tax=Tetrapisispora phaffii (strain ATCC 24235 / CBS 4417 / NBRC 1672 / NRRL Y-8282 / UCD 70-5) TaxID=1071381 RepID=G8BN39_TETPH|nr:hypothetical protein TPHA_0A02350 [Tetrapisispora phaffii CBS 4417]CCE61317.1 hypothetical protein TPHA_0A02350 [Tetrapisispora phaffii CBS 4417]